MIAILQGDARALPLPDDSVHAIVTDPPYELAFMARRWDRTGVAFDSATWREACRVLRPGGHLVAFGGTRTYHRMVCAMEDAGLEIRDSLHWIYGSGFPKSLDVGKALDHAAGAEREVIGMRTTGIGTGRGDVRRVCDSADRTLTAPATDAARAWSGWGTGLRPAHEPIVLARKPLAGSVATNVVTHGTGALHIDACRVGTTGATAGRWPANLVLSHRPECAEACAADCAVAELDRQSGASCSRSSARQTPNAGTVAMGAMGGTDRVAGHDDQGSASRFFPVFRYEAKAGNGERPRVDGVAHPTVKPWALMRWLVALVTPPGGLVLDPFAGSGTTLEAARFLGHHAVGVDLTPEYLPLIEARLGRALF